MKWLNDFFKKKADPKAEPRERKGHSLERFVDIQERVYGRALAEVTFSEQQIPRLAESDILEVRDFALNGWTLGETHGLPHWQRVERNGILLSSVDGRIREGINIKVVRFFAYLHDKCRIDNWKDIEHGVRAAEMLPTIKDTILKDFTDEEFSLLERACRFHTTERHTGNPTIDVCFDADRLDLGRVGIIPNPKLMATEQGAYFAANIHLIDEMGIPH